jgi:hypothetical protein
MTAPEKPAEVAAVEIDLRNTSLAALLAWLWPGAGHLYQGRYAKGVLFMVCILGTFFFGLALGEGKVVYAGDSGRQVASSGWRRMIQRWPYLLQLGVGLPATPAILQTAIVRRGGKPILGGLMAPPRDGDELAAWNKQLNQRFDLGMLYTMVAGLLNVLAIYDAYAGPVAAETSDEKRPPPDKAAETSGPKK